MIYIFMLTSCALFVELFLALDIKNDAFKLIKCSRDAMDTVSSTELADYEKEAFMRRASIHILSVTFTLLFKFLVIGAILSLLYALTILVDPASKRLLLETIVTPFAIVSLTLVAIFYSWLRNAIFKKL